MYSMMARVTFSICIALSLVVSAAAQSTPQKLLSDAIKQDNKKGAKGNSNNKRPQNGKAQVSESAKPPNAKSVQPKTPAPIAQSRQDEIFRFVQQHVPEIKTMLETLQKRNQSQFQVAMRGLDREIRNLKNQQSRAPDRYELSLKLWTVRSKVKLTAAKISTTKAEKQRERLKNQLKDLINEQFKLRRAQLDKELKTYENRVEKIKDQISKLDQQKAKEAQRQIEAMDRAAQKLKSNNKKNNKKNRPKNNKADQTRKSDG